MAVYTDAKGTCQIEGSLYPAVGFGTYPLQDKECFKAVLHAANLGYRIIDTATFYKNFTPIGEALNIFGRENFYIISKVWPDAQTPSLLNADLSFTLRELQTTYLDAYLLHWPNSRISIEDALRVMDELKHKQLIRHIGLSNITAHHLKRALEVGPKISWVQVEMHPLFYDAELLEMCQIHEITVQGWAPLGRGRVCQDPLLMQLGKKHKKTAAQIALRWIVQHGCIPLPGSRNEQHIQHNLDIMDFSLSQYEMQEINKRAKSGCRERVSEELGLGFSDEFDFSYEECWPKQ